MKYQLIDVCNEMLDNANLFLDFSAFPKIQLDFIVYGSVDEKYWKVIFYCDQIIDLKMESEDDVIENDLYTVFDVSVHSENTTNLKSKFRHKTLNLEEIEFIWFISIYGSLPMEIACGQFSWKLQELTFDEYDATFL